MKNVFRIVALLMGMSALKEVLRIVQWAYEDIINEKMYLELLLWLMGMPAI